MGYVYRRFVTGKDGKKYVRIIRFEHKPSKESVERAFARPSREEDPQAPQYVHIPRLCKITDLYPIFVFIIVILVGVVVLLFVKI